MVIILIITIAYLFKMVVILTIWIDKDDEQLEPFPKSSIQSTHFLTSNYWYPYTDTCVCTNTAIIQHSSILEAYNNNKLSPWETDLVRFGVIYFFLSNVWSNADQFGRARCVPGFYGV